MLKFPKVALMFDDEETCSEADFTLQLKLLRAKQLIIIIIIIIIIITQAF